MEIRINSCVFVSVIFLKETNVNNLKTRALLACLSKNSVHEYE